MAGPNMEVFRFGFYLFFPIFAMYKFGDPAWFETYVQPYKDYLLPPLEGSNKPPKTAQGLHEELSRLKAARKAKLGPSDGSLPATSSETVSISGSPALSTEAPSRTLEALAVDQAVKRDRAAGGTSVAAGTGQGSRWGWGGSSTDSTSGRLV